MTRLLLPVALLSIVCLTGRDALAHHHMHRNSGKMGAQAAAMAGNGQNLATPFVNPYLGYGYGPGAGFYPSYIPMIYPGVGYVSRVVPSQSLPGLPGNIYTQSYFNSPAYGHWNGFGTGK
jgi:hypothetical protein